MVNALIKILIILIIIYLLITAFTKVTKWILKVAIVVLVIGIFVLGYTSVSDFKIHEESNTSKVSPNVTYYNDTNQSLNPEPIANITNSSIK
ncbi:hypothetical protein D6777_03805 [Candidatus Woesearchaeota archaeon]|nr:MAG: hypothetical protein D6777_03805 [Candidatus Woesearchaeota archaeon]